ncbi:hypothetical protein MPER_11182, partial [Moniliophthora perniciosa FA553]
DGIPAYSIQTSQDGPTSSHQETILKTTNVTRLERRSSGRTETQVGQILYFGIDRLRLSLQYNDKEEFKLEVLNIQGNSSVDLGSSSNSWSFTGPDDKPYKWQIFIQYPVLLLDDNSQTPIARYRRAKLGIVSRPRRPFLEIFPAGINCIDLIVATFVSYMIQKFPQITQTR